MILSESLMSPEESSYQQGVLTKVDKKMHYDDWGKWDIPAK
jgi:hypothetical protein